MSEKIIKDPIHGYIPINAEELKILNTKYFERLHFIRHLGMGYLIYPSANHTRFEHSLGVMHLGSLVFDHLENKFESFWKDADLDARALLKKTFRLACLFHDIGHFPFSHTLENIADKNSIIKKIGKYDLKLATIGRSYEKVTDGTKHELMSCIIVLEKYKEQLEEMSICPKAICGLILGSISETVKNQDVYYNILRQILKGPFDVDKLDYLLRDNYMTGAKLVTLDVDRAITMFKISQNDLFLSDKSLSTICNLLYGRDQMFQWVYQHHKVVFVESLMRRLFNKLVSLDASKKHLISPDGILLDLIDDIDILSAIRNAIKNGKSDDEFTQMYNMFTSRQYLASCWKHSADLNGILESIDDEKYTNKFLSKTITRDFRSKIEEELKETLKTKMLFVAKAEFTPFTPKTAGEIYVDVNGSIKSLNKLKIYNPASEYIQFVPYIFCEKEFVQECINKIKQKEITSIL